MTIPDHVYATLIAFGSLAQEARHLLPDDAPKLAEQFALKWAGQLSNDDQVGADAVVRCVRASLEL